MSRKQLEYEMATIRSLYQMTSKYEAFQICSEYIDEFPIQDRAVKWLKRYNEILFDGN